MHSAWAEPTQADPEGYDEEEPTIYAPRNEDAADMDAGVADFKDYGVGGGGGGAKRLVYRLWHSA